MPEGAPACVPYDTYIAALRLMTQIRPRIEYLIQSADITVLDSY